MNQVIVTINKKSLIMDLNVLLPDDYIDEIQEKSDRLYDQILQQSILEFDKSLEIYIKDLAKWLYKLTSYSNIKLFEITSFCNEVKTSFMYSYLNARIIEKTPIN